MPQSRVQLARRLQIQSKRIEGWGVQKMRTKGVVSQTPRSSLQTVLVVDDDVLMRRLAKQVLGSFGMQVVEAGSGEEALDVFAHTDIDTVLLDLRMPGMGGFEACRRIRSQSRGRFLPIIVASGLDDCEAVEAAYDAGATDFAAKPLDWTQLKHRIRYTANARAMAEELALSNARRHGLLRTLRDTVISLDRAGRVLSTNANPAAAAEVESLFPVGGHFADGLPEPTRGHACAALQDLGEEAGHLSVEFELQHAEGPLAYELSLAPAGSGEFVATLRDLTARRRAEEEVRRLAYYDPVTGLPNRAWLRAFINDRLPEDARPGSITTLLHVDLRGMEYTRSLLGSELANQLIARFAEKLVDVAVPGAPADTPASAAGCVGRVSDSGFVVLRDDLDSEEFAQEFADRLQRAVDGSYTLGDYEIKVATRIGVSMSAGQDEANADRLLDQAATASAGLSSGHAFYSNRATERWRQRVKMVSNLQVAVDNGEFHLEYQPKVDTVSRELRGLEALLRWNHPEHGAISPGVFIPLAEESGLILPIGEFVLEEACRQSRRWNAAGHGRVPIAINFSGHQFSKKGLVGGFKRTLDAHDVSSGEIEIELTETVAMENCLGITDLLKQLRELGIRAAIDDFGTGYSSLDNLRRFDFHTLKIDRSFIADIGSNPSAGSIIRGIISMSHALGLQVVAEGVEDQYQLDFLKSQHCDQVQGFFTGRPTLPGEIEKMLPMVGA